jgi:hypothetical protein
MAIAKRPGSNKAPVVNKDEQAIEEFIEGKTQQPASTRPAKKVGIMVYFDPEVVKKVDGRAKKEGLSRSAWLHSKAIRALEEE